MRALLRLAASARLLAGTASEAEPGCEVGGTPRFPAPGAGPESELGSSAELSESLFADCVRESQTPWLVHFHSGRCGTCQEFQPTWRELVRRLSVHRPSLNCRAGRVDIDERENLRLASEEGVLGSGVPSIALYGGRGAAAAIVWAYDATRDDLESSFPSAAELEGAVAARCREDEEPQQGAPAPGGLRAAGGPIAAVAAAAAEPAPRRPPEAPKAQPQADAGGLRRTLGADAPAAPPRGGPASRQADLQPLAGEEDQASASAAESLVRTTVLLWLSAVALALSWLLPCARRRTWRAASR